VTVLNIEKKKETKEKKELIYPLSAGGGSGVEFV
jgi:hypothetical protein